MKTIYWWFMAQLTADICKMRRFVRVDDAWGIFGLLLFMLPTTLAFRLARFCTRTETLRVLDAEADTLLRVIRDTHLQRAMIDDNELFVNWIVDARVLLLDKDALLVVENDLW